MLQNGAENVALLDSKWVSSDYHIDRMMTGKE